MEKTRWRHAQLKAQSMQVERELEVYRERVGIWEISGRRVSTVEDGQYRGGSPVGGRKERERECADGIQQDVDRECREGCDEEISRLLGSWREEMGERRERKWTEVKEKGGVVNLNERRLIKGVHIGEGKGKGGGRGS